MILYFSATGNNKYVAAKLAAATGDEIKSITDCNNKKDYTVKLKENESLGIVCPTYFWGFPTVVSEYLDKMKLEAKNPYIYFVATYGKTPGAIKKYMQKSMKKQGYEVNAYFGVQMPDTWTPIFNLSDPDHVNDLNAKADQKIQEVCEKAAKHVHGDHMTRKLPYGLGTISNGMFYDQFRKTKHLKLNDACIGCGLCANRCPAHAIEIMDHKAVWVKDQCAMCLGCLHRCPVNAIEYGNSKKHGQYQHPDIEK